MLETVGAALMITAFGTITLAGVNKATAQGIEGTPHDGRTLELMQTLGGKVLDRYQEQDGQPQQKPETHPDGGSYGVTRVIRLVNGGALTLAMQSAMNDGQGHPRREDVNKIAIIEQSHADTNPSEARTITFTYAADGWVAEVRGANGAQEVNSNRDPHDIFGELAAAASHIADTQENSPPPSIAAPAN